MTKIETIIRILVMRQPEDTLTWTRAEWDAAKATEADSFLAWYPNGVELDKIRHAESLMRQGDFGKTQEA